MKSPCSTAPRLRRGLSSISWPQYDCKADLDQAPLDLIALRLGVTAEVLAQRSQTDYPTLSKIIQGRATIPLRMLRLLRQSGQDAREILRQQRRFMLLWRQFKSSSTGREQ